MQLPGWACKTCSSSISGYRYTWIHPWKSTKWVQIRNKKLQNKPTNLNFTLKQQQEQGNFPIWKSTRSQKRTSTQAKLPSLKPKFFRPVDYKVDEDDENEYESWNKKR